MKKKSTNQIKLLEIRKSRKCFPEENGRRKCFKEDTMGNPSVTDGSYINHLARCIGVQMLVVADWLVCMKALLVALFYVQ